MAIDGYMFFFGYDKTYLQSKSQVSLTHGDGDCEIVDPFVTAAKAYSASSGLRIEDYNFDIEQTLNIGSASSGAGAGKITFNPFSITRKVDRASPIFFQMACSGKSFQTVGLRHPQERG